MIFTNKTAIIIRSIPGAGKSYLANQILEKNPNGIVCCADDYFMVDGTYRFNPDKLFQAHRQCKNKFFQGLLQSICPLIVANTNTTWKEIRDYIELIALVYEDHNWDVFLAEPATSWARNAEACYKKNTHGVPLAAIQRMLNRYEANASIIEKARSAFGIEIKELNFKGEAL